MYTNFEIGSRYIIWITPSCHDVVAEIVSYDKNGNPIVKTLEGKNSLTLSYNEYAFPSIDERETLDITRRNFKAAYGEEI